VDHPRASCESGNAYLTETWPGSDPGAAPLQRQVQMLFTGLAAKLGETRSLREFMDARVMSAYFIPFRSPSIAALGRREELSEFAAHLWSAVFERWMPKCILTIDTKTFGSIKKMLAVQANTMLINTRLWRVGFLI
jgi:hypothetical protein